MYSKLSIGTANFGLNYGINNIQPPCNNEIKKILNYSSKIGIINIDTAIGYKNSKKIQKSISKNWRITSKIPNLTKLNINIEKDLTKLIEDHLLDLNQQKLHCLLLHNAEDLLNFGDKLWNILIYLKKNKIVNKIGYSVYSPTILNKLFFSYKPDVVQAPFNLFDRRLSNSNWLKKLNSEGIEIQIRSIFLQGLLLDKKIQKEKFMKFDNHFLKYYNWLHEKQLTALEACIQFVKNYEIINNYIIGVKNLSELLLITECFANNKKIAIPKYLKSEEYDLIDPNYW